MSKSSGAADAGTHPAMGVRQRACSLGRSAVDRSGEGRSKHWARTSERHALTVRSSRLGPRRSSPDARLTAQRHLGQTDSKRQVERSHRRQLSDGAPKSRCHLVGSPSVDARMVARCGHYTTGPGASRLARVIYPTLRVIFVPAGRRAAPRRLPPHGGATPRVAP